MTPEEYQSRSLYEQLHPGDRVEVLHGVTAVSYTHLTLPTIYSV